MQAISEETRLKPHLSATLLVSRAVAVGKTLQSPETGFLHYSFESVTEAPSQTIPLAENFLWMYALFRSHQKPLMCEAQELLSKLLAFQTEDGGFPIYLHEYPLLRKEMLNIRILLALAFTIKHYTCIIPSPLKEHTKQALGRLLTFCSELNLSRSATYQIDGILHILYGKPKPELTFTPSTAKEWGDVLTVGQFFGETFSIPWSEKEGAFIGSLAHEFQEGDSAKITPLHLHLLKELPSSLKSSIAFLWGGLVHHECNIVYLNEEVSREYRSYQGNEWLLTTTASYVPEKLVSPGFHLFRILSGKSSFVCSAGKYQVETSMEKEQFVARFFFKEELKEDELIELEFYFNRGVDNYLALEGGIRTSTFSLGEKLELCLEGKKFPICFQAEPEINMMGHVLYGNRPSQSIKDAKKSGNLYDGVIALRTLSRPKGATLTMTLSLS